MKYLQARGTRLTGQMLRSVHLALMVVDAK